MSTDNLILDSDFEIACQIISFGIKIEYAKSRLKGTVCQ